MSYTEIVQRSEKNSVLVGPTTYRENSFEHALRYTRKDGKRVEMVLVHVPNVAGDAPFSPAFAIGTFRTHNNPNNNPTAEIHLSMEEARLLRDFLNRPEIFEYLEEEM